MDTDKMVRRLRAIRKQVDLLVQEVVVDEKQCTCCGRATYSSFNRKQARDHLMGVVTNLAKAAGRLKAAEEAGER
jgi:hypothetical protein